VGCAMGSSTERKKKKGYILDVESRRKRKRTQGRRCWSFAFIICLEGKSLARVDSKRARRKQVISKRGKNPRVPQAQEESSAGSP